MNGPIGSAFTGQHAHHQSEIGIPFSRADSGRQHRSRRTPRDEVFAQHPTNPQLQRLTPPGKFAELGIGRVLREDLVARGAAGTVLAAGLRATEVDYDYTLVVRVLACEGGADGAVHFRAVWELATTGLAPKLAARGEVQPASLRWDGKSEGALAAQLSKAVAILAEDVAAGLGRAGK